MINQKIFKEAAKTKKASKLLQHLKTLSVGQDLVDELAKLVRQTSELLSSRPNPAGQAARDKMLADVRDFVGKGAVGLDFDAFDRALALLRIAEDGHHRILATLQQTSFAKETAAVRAAAVIARAEAGQMALAASLDAALKAAERLTMPNGPELKDQEGHHVNADASMSMSLDALRGTLVMEAYANKWFSGDGQWLTLPALPEVSEEKILLAEQAENLAISWVRWERSHEKARFFGVDIETLGADRLPEIAQVGITRIYERQEGGMLVDFIANERAIDREGKSAADLFGTTNIGRIGKGIDGEVGLPPTEWISDQEALNSLSLSEVVGYNIFEDLDKPGGLRLIQWVRGYMALSTWASTRGGSRQNLILEIDPADARDLLQRLSFTTDEANLFLDTVSFNANSRDFFDAPIVRTQGRWLIIGAAVFAPRMAKIVPSLLASIGVQLKRKGSAFESRVVNFFKSHGLDARHVKVKREGAEYDYDVMVRWCDYIFHFECKNHGLSGNDPQQTYHFLQEVSSNIGQTIRLREGLSRWPDIITTEFGPEAEASTIIHCILHNETFCYPGGIEGIFIYDWSALTRFFEAGWFRVIHDHRGPDNVVFRNRVGVKQIWSGEQPVPADLLKALQNPTQYQIALHHVRQDRIVFQLDAETVAIDSLYSREPGDTRSYAEALGVSGEAIEEQLARVDEQISAAIAQMKLREE